MARQQIVDAIAQAVQNISNTEYSYDRITRWASTDSQYEKNHVDIKDLTEKSKRENKIYISDLIVSVSARLWQTGNQTASQLGNLAIADLMCALRDLPLPVNGFVGDISTYKNVENKGKPCCQIELEIQIKYRN